MQAFGAKGSHDVAVIATAGSNLVLLGLLLVGANAR